MINELICCCECDDNDKLTIAKIPIHNIVEEEKHLLKCEFGHITLIISDSQKFENLIYLAFVSFNNNFYHQAVVNIANAYENLQEFIIRLILEKNEIKISEIDNSIKKMKLSERRFGGFYYLFLNQFKVSPNVPNPNKEIKFRNEVVHNGYFCTKEETFNYVFEMYKIIIETIYQIENTGFEILDSIVNRTTLKLENLNELKETYIHNVTFHNYIGTRTLNHKVTKEDLISLLDKIPNYSDLVISGIMR
jgi:hypothetical protein